MIEIVFRNVETRKITEVSYQLPRHPVLCCSRGFKWSANNLSTLLASSHSSTGKYSEPCDIWSFGVVMFVMLFGYPPFHGSSDDQIFAKIKQVLLGFSNL